MLLGEVERAVRLGLASLEDRLRVYTLIGRGMSPGSLPTIAQLSGAASLKGQHYTLGVQGQGGFYGFAMAGERLLIFIPWLSDAVRCFDTELAMAGWLRTYLQDTQVRSGFIEAARGFEQDRLVDQQVSAVVHSIANAHSDHAALALLSLGRVLLTTDVFTYLADQAKAGMQRSAAAMRDNTQLRTAMLGGYLSAFLKVFAGVAPLGWPVGLTVLGATVVKLAVDVENALHSLDDEARRSALRDAMLDSLFAALNMTDLGFASSFATLAYQPPSHEVLAAVTEWEVSSVPVQVLEGLELNEVGAGELVTAGRLRGVHLGDDGRTWITLSGVSYRVRFSEQLSRWLIVPPDDPLGFSPVRPVQLNQAGQWELLVAPSLPEIQPTAVEGIPNETSPLWDVYTQAQPSKSQAHSARALARQKRLLAKGDIPVIAPGVAPDVDSHGLPCVMIDGKPSYSFRQGRDYYNCLIDYYTDEDSQINLVFREGVYRHYDMNSYVNRLADTLERLPKDNSVPLFRGGHGVRGTSGEFFLSGKFKVGDVLVNTDLTSFTENPYKVRDFAARLGKDASGAATATFDDTSVVFELPAHSYHNGTPISPFACYWDEAEVLFLPGSYFKIDRITQVYGAEYRFVHILLNQVDKPAEGTIYDLRTGEAFDRQAYITRLKSAELVDRFFPLRADATSFDAPDPTL